MHPKHYSMTMQDVYGYAVTMLLPHLKWKDVGRKCQAETVLQLLFYAAANLCSLAAACQRLAATFSDQAVRTALARLCPDSAVVEDKLNRSYAHQLPKALSKRRQRLAIDLTLLPYHGQAHQRAEEVYRGEAKSGTTHFHAYASCYIVHKGKRYTVALRRVEQGTSMVEVIRSLLQIAARAGIQAKLLLLDRGFFSVEVIRYLQAARYAYLMPVMIRGRKANHAKGPSGTRVFVLRNRSGWDRYTMTRADKTTASFSVCIHCRNTNGRYNRRGRKALVYAYGGMTPTTTVWVYETYRLRFGIETSYRQLQQARITTTTRNPAMRLLFVGIALFLRNLWVWVHYARLATPRRGGRQTNLNLLPFKRLTMWLARFAEHLFGVNEKVSALRAP